MVAKTVVDVSLLETRDLLRRYEKNLREYRESDYLTPQRQLDEIALIQRDGFELVRREVTPPEYATVIAMAGELIAQLRS